MIRDFDPRDTDAVTALSLRAWAPVFTSLATALGPLYHHMYPNGWHQEQEKAVRTTCTTEGTRTWVAETSGSVQGFVAARLDHTERMGEIHMIAVDPPHQGQGIGTALTTTALKWFKAQGMTLAMVETGGDPGHAPARKTYEKAGFTNLPIARYFKPL